jgi:hypothetical protein
MQGHKASIAIAIFQLLNLVLSDIGELPAPAPGLLLPPCWWPCRLFAC